MHQVAQGNARLHLTLEANKHGLRHVQRHHASCGREGDGAGARGEGDADREPRVGVAASADGVRDQHPVQPRVDDAITRAKGHAATLADEIRERVVRDHVHGLGVGGGVAEGLHDQVRAEAQASKILQLVAGHGAGGVLAADGGHLGLKVHARKNARQTASLGDHLLRQRVARRIRHVAACGAEDLRRRQAHGLAGPVRDLLADDEGHAAARLDTIQNDLALELEGGEHLVRAMSLDLALVREDVDDVTHVQACNVVGDDGQCTRVLHGVEEDGGHGAADADAAELFVGHRRILVAHEPEDGVRRGLARGAGAHDVADIRQREALLLEFHDLLLAI
mmetsp:Transcript_33767/g.110422  ORF Transcript_33767/g.110422 Transcript_33767/m.110422 type:complete len:336 (-) Transcript_33767:807-1814(-)